MSKLCFFNATNNFRWEQLLIMYYIINLTILFSYILKSFKCIAVGETTNGTTTWNVICAVYVARDGDTSTSMSHNFCKPSERTLNTREFNFNNGRVSAS